MANSLKLASIPLVTVALCAQPQKDVTMDTWKVRPVANDYVELIRSPDPQRVYCYTPGLALCPSGRLVATTDLGGPGVKGLPGVKRDTGNPKWVWCGRIFTSDDRGLTWTARGAFPFRHARPFVAGSSLYILGQAGDLMVIRSDDWGESWSEPVHLTKGERWHQSACNTLTVNGSIYLVMESRPVKSQVRGWNVAEVAPVLMRADVTDDLTQREAWTFAGELRFCEAVKDRQLDMFGVPFYPAFYPRGFSPAPGRPSAPSGWLETNVVQFTDPDHIWHDPEGKTFHLLMRSHTGGTGYACLAKVVESEDGSMTTMLETAPSGKKAVFLPCPGGHNRFHILYDRRTALYWLLSVQSTDSMTRADRLPANRYNLPCNERHRLQLHFSRNCVDWCFAALVAVGPALNAARHYASMVIDGDDLHVLSRSGDKQAKSAHDGNIITFHTIPNFRRLVY